MFQLNVLQISGFGSNRVLVWQGALVFAEHC